MNSHAETAQILDLTAARNAPSRVATNSLGRRLGAHGNRFSQLTIKAAIRQLTETYDLTGEVTSADLREVAAEHDTVEATVRRWWKPVLARLAAANQTLPDGNAAPAPVSYLHTNNSGGHDEAPDDYELELAVDPVTGRVDPYSHVHGDPYLVEKMMRENRYLYRHLNPNQLQLTVNEAQFILAQQTVKKAIKLFHADPRHRLSTYSRASIYRAYKNLSPVVLTGAKKGAEAAKRIEAGYPLSGRDLANESWSIDQYTLKCDVVYRNARVTPKLLVVRDRASGLIRSYQLLTREATGEDTGVALATAALGYTVDHPHIEGETFRVAGLPRFITSDQGSEFFGEDGSDAARDLGIPVHGIDSHAPQSNGDHEQMHRSLGYLTAVGPGSRRGHLDRTGKRANHGLPPWEWLVELIDNWVHDQIHAQFTKSTDPRRGRSRIGVFVDLVESDQVFHGHDIDDADVAGLAMVLTERAYDPTRGLEYMPAGASYARYYNSPALSRLAEPSQKIVLKGLGNNEVLYAFDKHDRYIGWVTPRDDSHSADIVQQYDERAERERFVEHVADLQQVRAIVDATRAWAATGVGLAKAAELATADHPKRAEHPDDGPDLNRPALTAVADSTDNTDGTDGTDDVASSEAPDSRNLTDLPAQPAPDTASKTGRDDSDRRAQRYRDARNTNSPDDPDVAETTHATDNPNQPESPNP